MARLPNPRLIKIHRSYSVDEVSRTLHVHKNTVRTWIKDGLAKIDSHRPTLIHGLELRSFLEQRRKRNRVKLQPGQIFCLRCRVGKEPAVRIVDYLPISMTTGNLQGICPDCETLINRIVSLAQIDTIRGNLEITFPQVKRRIRDRTSARVNSDFKRESRDHDNS
jgi:hypothetical protein